MLRWLSSHPQASGRWECSEWSCTDTVHRLLPYHRKRSRDKHSSTLRIRHPAGAVAPVSNCVSSEEGLLSECHRSWRSMSRSTGWSCLAGRLSKQLPLWTLYSTGQNLRQHISEYGSSHRASATCMMLISLMACHWTAKVRLFHLGCIPRNFRNPNYSDK